MLHTPAQIDKDSIGVAGVLLEEIQERIGAKHQICDLSDENPKAQWRQ